jgi:response regulator RpfG family c-di-GMP phosphodiesterase
MSYQLSEEAIKQIFFYCDLHDEGAVVADDVDICQLVNKSIAHAEPDIVKREHQRCIKIVEGLNPNVAIALARALGDYSR